MAANAPKIHFSLEQAEHERAEERAKIEPFTADIRGRQITFKDARDVEWTHLMDIDQNPVLFLKYCVEDDADRTHLLDTKMSGDAMERLTKAYRRHYGLGEQGNVAASLR